MALAADPAPERLLDLRAVPLAVAPGVLDHTRLTVESAVELVSSDPEFGGLSGMLLEADRLRAVTDLGRYVEIAVTRDADGALRRFGPARIGRLRDAGGVPLRGASADAEALAAAPDGRIWAAFERGHRVVEMARLGGPTTAEAAQLPVEGLVRNGGIEALAIDRRGALLAIAEEPIAWRPEALSGWRMIAGRAQPFVIARDGGFAATGAEIGPDGALYLLERRYRLLSGVRVRLRRFAPERLAELAAAPPAAEPFDLGAGETLAELDARLPIDNMEAIAVEAAPDGDLRITLLADDNFSALQRTVLMQLRYRPAR